MARTVAGELGVTVAALVGDLDRGAEQARAAEAAGAEVIISRGGTASTIAAAVSLPVVEIRVTSSDVLRCFRQLETFHGKVGLAGFSNIIYGCEEVGGLLGLEMVQVPIAGKAEAERVVAAAQAAGVRHLIGDHISYLCARQMGMGATLIESGREGIAQAIFEAQHVLRVRCEERAKSQQVRTILDSVSDGILAVDANGRVILFNPQAERVFGLSAAAVIGKRVTDVIPGSHLDEVLRSGRPQVGEIQQVGQNRLAATRRPVRVGNAIVGAVATLHDVTELQKYEQLVRQKLNRHGHVARHSLESIVCVSAVMRRVVADARRYAPTDATVLVLGESGVGKELLAQGIHRASRRRQGPFVAVNCAAMPETLLESELFGYEQGAFTGARKGGKQGLFELAHGGTIFLDEVGEMPLSLQSRLLRVLQEKEVMRLGGDAVIPVDVRVIAATNRDLTAELAAGRFREDLYYRLDLLRLQVPPLRERPEDIPALVDDLGVRLQETYGRRPAFGPAALAVLQRHRWPGNVRELANLLERLALVSEGNSIDAGTVAAYLPAPAPASPGRAHSPATPAESWPDNLTLAEIEKLAIGRALAAERGNLQRAAARLGLHRTTLYRKLQQYDTKRNVK
jgi:PAS domain S-box-containing protein